MEESHKRGAKPTHHTHTNHETMSTNLEHKENYHCQNELRRREFFSRREDGKIHHSLTKFDFRALYKA